jgi:hypothetical protein
MLAGAPQLPQTQKNKQCPNKLVPLLGNVKNNLVFLVMESRERHIQAKAEQRVLSAPPAAPV